MKNHPSFALIVLAGFLGSGCSELLVDNYQYGTIEVQARLDSGEPAEGVELLLYRNTEHLAYGRTNAEGEYTFAFAPNGSLGVLATLAPRYTTDEGQWDDFRDQIEVPDGRVAQVVFTELRRVGAPAARPGGSDDDRSRLEEVSAACPAGGEAATAVGLQEVAIRSAVLATDSSGAGAGDCS